MVIVIFPDARKHMGAGGGHIVPLALPAGNTQIAIARHHFMPVNER
jgi:hypothetical protein